MRDYMLELVSEEDLYSHLVLEYYVCIRCSMIVILKQVAKLLLVQRQNSDEAREHNQ